MKTRHFMMLAIIAGVAAMIPLSGCKKQEPSAPDQPQTEAMTEHEHPAVETTEETAAQAAETEQTVCPVMGGPINKDIFVEYQGKKVYFCCAGCEETFLKAPEKYLSKLPQFQNEQ